VRGSWAVTNGQDVRATVLPRVVCMYAELFVLRRKASTNNHTTTLADSPLSLDILDW
jgi:hypothetical protein